MNKDKVKVLPLWLILWFLIGPAVYLRNSIARGDVDLGKTIFMSLIMGIPLVIGGLIGWGVLLLIYKLVAPGQKISAKVALTVWIVIAILLFTVPLISQKNKVQQPVVSKEYQISTLNAINEVRAQQGLPALTADDKLCAFAKKQAIDFNQAGNSDKDGLNDPANTSYFVGYKDVVLDSIEGGLLSGDKEMATTFMERKGQGAARLGLTHGCVADSAGSGGKLFTVFVGAVKQ